MLVGAFKMSHDSPKSFANISSCWSLKAAIEGLPSSGYELDQNPALLLGVYATMSSEAQKARVPRRSWMKLKVEVSFVLSPV